MRERSSIRNWHSQRASNRWPLVSALAGLAIRDPAFGCLTPGREAGDVVCADVLSTCQDQTPGRCFLEAERGKKWTQPAVVQLVQALGRQVESGSELQHCGWNAVYCRCMIGEPMEFEVVRATSCRPARRVDRSGTESMGTGGWIQQS